MSDPSGENWTQWTQLRWPLKSATFFSDVKSHSWDSNIQENNHESIRSQQVNSESTRSQKVNHVSTRSQQVNLESIRCQQVNSESIRSEQVNSEPTRSQQVNCESTRSLPINCEQCGLVYTVYCRLYDLYWYFLLAM